MLVQHKFLGGTAFKTRIDGLDITDNGRRSITRILEIEGPFNRREIRIRDPDTPDTQPGFWVAIDQRVLRTVRIKLLSGSFKRPGVEKG